MNRKYITRLDHKNTHGWWVRVYLRSKPVYNKLFSDGVHGGKLKALKAAKSYRDKVCKKAFGKAMQPGARRTWGKGVYRQEDTKPNGYVTEAWVAFWSQGGKQHRRSYSVYKYGERQAKKMAQEARASGLASRR
jgi:hypothetical protein